MGLKDSTFQLRGMFEMASYRADFPELSVQFGFPQQNSIMTSIETCKTVADISPSAILSFSMGKDSIGAYIHMQRYFENVEFVFLYMIPDLEFQNIALDYYEHKLGKHVVRFPHPSLYRQLYGHMYQHPRNLDIIYDFEVRKDNPEGWLYKVTYDDIFNAAKIHLGMPDNTFVGTGVRSDDSVMRRSTISKYGAINYNRKQFFPVHDWSTKHLIEEIRQSGIKLPIDYKIWGRSFDGFDYRFLKGLKDNFPRDYEKVMEFFPLVDLEFLRYKTFAA